MAPSGRKAVKKPKEEEKPPPVVSSSSSSLPAATSVRVKQEEAEVKDEAVGLEVNVDNVAHFKNEWEPGNWCWLDDDDNWNSALVAVKEEEAGIKEEKE